MSPTGLVVASLGPLEAVSGQGLDGVGRAGDQLVHVLLRLERRQNVVGPRPPIAATGPPDADAKAQEALRAERLRDRAQAIVAGKSAAEARLESTRPEVDVVVDDEERRRIHLEEPRGGRERATRLVHVGLRLQQCDAQPVDARLREAARELGAERAAVPARQLVGDEPADVVPRPLVLVAGIAETGDKQVERRGLLAPTQQAHLLLGALGSLAGGFALGLGRYLALGLGSLLALRQLRALLGLLGLG